MRHTAPKDAAELDAAETREWLDSLDYVLQSGGPVKVARLLRELMLHATENGVKFPFTANTPYINTITAQDQVLMSRGLHIGLAIDEYKTELGRGDFLIRAVTGADEATGAMGPCSSRSGTRQRPTKICASRCCVPAWRATRSGRCCSPATDAAPACSIGPTTTPR